MTEMLSEHFSLAEMIYSDTARARGIDNTPTPIHKANLKHTAQYLLEPLRKAFNDKYKVYQGKAVDHVGIRITSGYRSEKLNTAVGGSKTSAHAIGCAADFEAVVYFKDDTKKTIPYTESYEFLKRMGKEHVITFDQLIQEKSGSTTWTHIGTKPQLRDCRKQCLKYNNGSYVLDKS